MRCWKHDQHILVCVREEILDSARLLRFSIEGGTLWDTFGEVLGIILGDQADAAAGECHHRNDDDFCIIHRVRHG